MNGTTGVRGTMDEGLRGHPRSWHTWDGCPQCTLRRLAAWPAMMPLYAQETTSRPNWCKQRSQRHAWWARTTRDHATPHKSLMGDVWLPNEKRLVALWEMTGRAPGCQRGNGQVLARGKQDLCSANAFALSPYRGASKCVGTTLCCHHTTAPPALEAFTRFAATSLQCHIRGHTSCVLSPLYATSTSGVTTLCCHQLVGAPENCSALVWGVTPHSLPPHCSAIP